VFVHNVPLAPSKDTLMQSNVLYTADLHARSTYGGVTETSDPLPCGSAVALHLVRHMLVTEERANAGQYSGNLLLLAGTPRAWFANDKEIQIRNAPTHFGPIDLDVRSRITAGQIEARVTCPTRNPCNTIRLRMRHLDGKPIQSVTVNGKPHADFDARKEWITLPGSLKGPIEVVAHY
jgi:hypothetical protein